MSLTRPSLFARKRRPQATVSVQSGFVLIFVLLAGLILIMTAVSLVSRATSGATTTIGESRTQAARMAAETGFNTIMARINKEDIDTFSTFIDSENKILGAPTTSYMIVNFSFNPDLIPNCDPTNDIGIDINISIRGKLIAGSNDYFQDITRTLRVCKPIANPTQVRVRSFS